MRTSTRWDCDTGGNPGCEVKAACTFICKVEGREVALCRPCDRRWKEYAKDNPGLEWRCPNCAPAFLIAQQNASSNTRVRIPGEEEPILKGPLADLIDAAMYRNGILIDIRRRVLASLYNSSVSGEDYAATLLRTTAGTPL